MSRLLITGGTGSFGNEVLKKFLPVMDEIRIFSRDEKKQDDMRHIYDDPKITYVIGDVRDYKSIRGAMEGIDYVFHASALKQVPSCEQFPFEAVKTNIIGTENTLSAAIDAKVSRVVVLSTDKAVHPVNAMGISKAMMEKIMVAKSVKSGYTRICGTRYGNVMCSRGSVIPLFLEQAKQGKPLTITDPSMTRFMMDLSEAVDLVEVAFNQGLGGDIYVYTAPAATVATLADVCRGLVGSTVPHIVTGRRPGEKQHETLISEDEIDRTHKITDQYLCIQNNLMPSLIQGELTEPFTSGTTKLLNYDELKALLLKLDYVQKVLA